MDHHHEQKEFDYDDGQHRYRLRSETHTYRSTSNVPAIGSSSSSSHMDMHAQLHQQAMNNHHQLAMNSMNMMHETMRSNMQSFHSLGAPPQRRQLTYRRAFEKSSSEDESPSESSDDDGLVVTRRQNTELRTMTSQYTADRARLEQAGARLDKRIQRLEEQETKNKAEHEAKDAELRRLREENSKLHQQRHDDGEKHLKEVADIARAHAEKPATAAPALDMNALRVVVKQIQQSQLSKSDLEAIIQERVASQLEGVATKKDLAAAGSNMEKALSVLPSGASAAQVQKALSTELDRAVDKLASKVKPSGSTINNNTTIMYNQAMMSSAMGGSDSRLLKLGPDEHGGKHHKEDKKKKHKQKYIEDVPESSSKHKSKEEPVRKAIEAGPAHHDFAPSVADQSLVRTEKSRKESKSTVSVGEITSSALVKTKSSSSKHTPVQEAAHSSALVKAKSSSSKHSSATGDKAGEKSSHKDGKSSSSSSHEKKDKPMKTIMPAIAEGVTSTALAEVDKKKKAEESATSTALAKVDKRDNKDKTEELSSTALGKTDKKKKPEEPPTSTSLTKTGKKKHRDDISAIHVMEMPDLSSHSRLPTSGHEFELPDDFPENASMISTYERAQASKGRGIEASSSSAPSRHIGAPPGHGSSGALAKIKKDRK